MDDKRLYTHTDEERTAVQNCLDEAFWYRSLPLGSFCAGVATWAVAVGKIKSKSRLSAVPIVLGFGCLGYITGKFTYIFSDNCKNIFLDQAPDSIVSERIKQEREGYIENVPHKFMNIIQDIDHVTEKETQILDDCNKVAFYKFSLPLSSALGASMYLSVRKGMMRESKLMPAFPRLPKTLLGIFVGYIVGQWAYTQSMDCANRFQRFDHDGNIATLLRGEHPRQIFSEYETAELDKISEKRLNVYDKHFIQYHDHQDYVFPEQEQDLSKRIRKQWTNHLDPNIKF